MCDLPRLHPAPRERLDPPAPASAQPHVEHVEHDGKPAHASADSYARARPPAEPTVLQARLRACFKAGAAATDSQPSATSAPPAYSESPHDPVEAPSSGLPACGRRPRCVRRCRPRTVRAYR
ncbi:hypothetical protein Misp01_41450 [Microtetraspora sp. NBRC 13810]|uniref:hypothetical protein n=1 Tax=Microtetraspora sp. NBRC 13810 TaxID=3030990 RepID=UPI0025530EED|nr:hypothetical protein [Microtetraspora sp. NBRC 13810]GLW09015.1 hypothetical protein Misp01_41450 [Microtetraspora sp. NBRC 13810]